MNFRRLACLALMAAATLAHAAPPDAPPNLIAIDAKLVTSGQPSAEWLSTLAAQGFEAVIYLAPPTVGDAVRDEPLIAGRQGLIWANLPIRFDRPADADYEAFAALLSSLRGKKVLVHCQVNMRASTLTFLYRVLVEKVEPQQAWENVSKVWTPQGPWKALMVERLRKQGIAFDPF
ncbi:protein tyrosine phosphatase family protein [Pelomonas sp. SE-A7]|uniref:protein tyrosine phosphatase family protein n=1 Tax=Pelomonas sp. SE-A7 TaxID=3054953 RepID=UPI00259C6FC9|nr:protein tyrosine phosphatase family protein [Pelomonas sp. SE-A7]MDM4767766.1 protein tyrosine phosphatase family protein [Pelomonas sp. SE-A7]